LFAFGEENRERSHVQALLQNGPGAATQSIGAT